MTFCDDIMAVAGAVEGCFMGHEDGEYICRHCRNRATGAEMAAKGRTALRHDAKCPVEAARRILTAALGDVLRDALAPLESTLTAAA